MLHNALRCICTIRYFCYTMGRKLLFVYIILSFSSICSTKANYFFAYDNQCQKAYKYYMALQFEEGDAALRQALINNPRNVMATYIADYKDCLLLLFNGDKKDFDQLHHHLDQRLELIERGDKNTPWYRLCKGGLYMHWAFVHLRMGDNFKAATTFRKSFIILKENQRLYPSFEYDDIFFGLENAVVGTIPDDYKWIASFLGMKGNVKKGVEQIERFLDRHTPQDAMYAEAQVFYAYLKFYLLSQQDEAWQYVNSNGFSISNNLLFGFVRANIALNYRKADAALQTLKHMQGLDDYKRFPVLDYEVGAALLHKLEPAAIGYFNRFLSAYRGKLFIKDTWQKKAYAYYLQGDEQQALQCREAIKRYGTTDVDADKQAQRFAEQNVWPQTLLLQARLLIDGGYYQQALTKLSGKTEGEMGGITDKAEYNFRLGRAYDELGNDSKALEYYNRAISLGRERKEHFAARSSLQVGFIYEKRGNAALALASYKACLGMPVQDYKNSIFQQAKAGINRLTVK